MNEPVENPSPSASAFGDWAIKRLTKRWKIVVGLALLGGLATCTSTYLRTPEYLGRTSVFFPSKSSVLGPMQLVDAASAAAALTGSGPSPLRVYESFLLSQTAVKSIAKANGIKRGILLGKRSIDSDLRSSIITVSYVDADKERNLRVLRSHIAELAKINRKVAFDTAVDDASVIKGRLKDAESQLKKSEDELIKFQATLVSAPNITTQQGGAITAIPETWSSELIRLRLEQARVDTQLAKSKERVRMLASLPRDIPSELPPIRRMSPKLQEAEYDLAVKKLTLGPQSPQIRKLETQIAALRQEMEQEIRTYLEGVNVGIIDPSVTEGSLPQLLVQKASLAGQIAGLNKLANVAPEETVNLNRRFRQLALQASVVQQLTTQALTVSLQAQRDPNRWVVLDDPYVEDSPANKSYTRMGLAGLFLGTMFGCLVALIVRERPR
jgi:uncharacterized protein involved in exopolysaccharide biosynthesis